MILYIDADGCPVINIIEKICKEKEIPAVAVKDYNHELHSDYIEVITLEQGNDFADLYIANLLNIGDLVITNDMGLASLVLGKGANCINFYGDIIDHRNIDFLLFSRHIKEKGRRSNKYGKGQPARTSQDNLRFEQSLLNFLEKDK